MVMSAMLILRLNFWGASDLEDWSSLRTIPAATGWSEARDLFAHLYAPTGDWSEWIHLDVNGAWIRTHAAKPGIWLELPWPPEPEVNGMTNVENTHDDPGLLLESFRIALDPGHLGGAWGPMEKRSFQMNGGPVVQEGDLVHAAARRLQSQLESLGATVVLLHGAGAPATIKRPADFYLEVFRDLLKTEGAIPAPERVQQAAELHFYRQVEIQARAERVAHWKPDFVVALHLDAATWVDPSQPSPTRANHGHILINGAYLPTELANDDQRRAMVTRWRRGYAATEVALATSIAESMAAVTGLSPFEYAGANARRVNQNPYVWARNLMANRLFDAPVVYLEPWILNNQDVYLWASEGDYEGEREVNGRIRRSLPCVYAEFVFAGICNWAQSRHRTDQIIEPAEAN